MKRLTTAMIICKERGKSYYSSLAPSQEYFTCSELPHTDSSSCKDPDTVCVYPSILSHPSHPLTRAPATPSASHPSVHPSLSRTRRYRDTLPIHPETLHPQGWRLHEPIDWHPLIFPPLKKSLTFTHDLCPLRQGPTRIPRRASALRTGLHWP